MTSKLKADVLESATAGGVITVQGEGGGTIALADNTAITGTATVSSTLAVTGASTLSGQAYPTAGGLWTGRNVVINGDMGVAQRATSATGLGAANGYFTVDRFKVFVGGSTAGRFTMSQTAITDLGGFSNAMKFDVTTADASIAAGELFQIGTMFEGQDIQRFKKGHSDAESFTVSFYVKGTAKTYSVELFDGDNTRHVTQTFNVTTSWNRIILNFPADTTGIFDSDNALSLYILIWVHAGSDYTSGTAATSWAGNVNANRAVGCGSLFSSTANELFITGLQMEVGSVATPFEYESYAQNLQKCQRYYVEERFGSGSRYGGAAFAGVAWSTGEAAGTCSFPVPMRAAPTLTTVNSAGTVASIHVAAVGDVVGGVTIPLGISEKGFSAVGKSASWSVGNICIGGYQADAEL